MKEIKQVTFTRPPTLEELQAYMMSEDQLIFSFAAQFEAMPVGASQPIKLGTVTDLGVIQEADQPEFATLPYRPEAIVTVLASPEMPTPGGRYYQVDVMSPYYQGTLIALSASTAIWLVMQTLHEFPRVVYRWAHPEESQRTK